MAGFFILRPESSIILKFENSSLAEKEFLTRLSQGDPLALQSIVESHFPVLCKFALHFLPDADLAKDVVQETFIKFWRAGVAFDSLRSLKGFLYASTRNGCLNLIRSRERLENRHQAVYKDAPTEQMISTLTETVHLENLALVYQVISKLPPRMQEIFRLSYEEGMTIKDIAKQLNIKQNAVKNARYKTLTLLRSQLGNNKGGLLVILSLLLKK